jgi:hypothetical protein
MRIMRLRREKEMQENGRRNNIQKCCRMNDRNGIVSEIVK